MSQATVHVLVFLICLVVLVATQAPVKPEWPDKFDVAFGLSAEGNVTGGNAPIVNSTSHFWYDYGQKAQLIVYPDTCLPGVLPVRNFIGIPKILLFTLLL